MPIWGFQKATTIPWEDELEGRLEGESDFYNPFLDVTGDVGRPNGNRLEEWLVRALVLRRLMTAL